MRPTIVILILILLSGCARHINTRDTDRIIRVEKSLKYREGFAHGCKNRKLPYRFKNNSEYRDGWNHGYKYCRTPSDTLS